jgi:hypothetical protein
MGILARAGRDNGCLAFGLTNQPPHPVNAMAETIP